MSIRELLEVPVYNASWDDNIVVNGRFSVEERAGATLGRGLHGFYCTDTRKTLFQEVGHWRNGWWSGVETGVAPTTQLFSYSLRNGSPLVLTNLNETKDGEGCRLQMTGVQGTVSAGQQVSPVRTVLPVELMRLQVGRPLSLSMDFMSDVPGRYAIVVSYPHGQKHTTFFIDTVEASKLTNYLFNFVLPTDWFTDVTNDRHAPVTDPLSGGTIHVAYVTTATTDETAINGKFGLYPGSSTVTNYLRTSGVKFYVNNVALLPGVNQRPRPDKSQTPERGLYENIILPEVKGHARKTVTQDFKLRMQPSHDGAVSPYIRKYGFSEVDTVFGTVVNNQQDFDWTPWKLTGAPTSFRVTAVYLTDETTPTLTFKTNLTWTASSFQFCIAFTDGLSVIQYHWRNTGSSQRDPWELSTKIGKDLLDMIKTTQAVNGFIDVNLRIGKEVNLEYFLRAPRRGAYLMTPENFFAPIATQPNARPRISAYSKPDVFVLKKYEDDSTGDYSFSMKVDMPKYNQAGNFIMDVGLLGMSVNMEDVNSTYYPLEYKLLTAAIFDTSQALAMEINNTHLPMWVQTARGCALRDTWSFVLIKEGVVSPYTGFGQVDDTAIMGRSNWIDRLIMFAERPGSFILELGIPRNSNSYWVTQFVGWCALELTLESKSWVIIGYYDAAANYLAAGNVSWIVSPEGYPAIPSAISAATCSSVGDAIIKRVNQRVVLTTRPLYELGRIGLSIATKSLQSGDYYFRDVACPIGEDTLRTGGELLPFYSDLNITVGGYGPLRILSGAPNTLELTTIDCTAIDHAKVMGKLIAIDVIFLDHPDRVKLTFKNFIFFGTGAKYKAGVSMTPEFKAWLITTNMPLNIELVARLITLDENTYTQTIVGTKTTNGATTINIRVDTVDGKPAEPTWYIKDYALFEPGYYIKWYRDTTTGGVRTPAIWLEDFKTGTWPVGKALELVMAFKLGTGEILTYTRVFYIPNSATGRTLMYPDADHTKMYNEPATVNFTMTWRLVNA